MYLRIFLNCGLCIAYKVMHPSVLPGMTPKMSAEDWDITQAIWKWQALTAFNFALICCFKLKKKKKVIEDGHVKGLYSSLLSSSGFVENNSLLFKCLVLKREIWRLMVPSCLEKKKKKKSFFLPIHSRFFPAPHNLDHEPVGAISL